MKKPIFIVLASILVTGLFGAAVVSIDHFYYPTTGDSGGTGDTDSPSQGVILDDVAACYGKKNVINSKAFELTATDTMKAGYAAEIKKGDSSVFALVYTLHTAVSGCDSFDFYVGIENGKVASFAVGELIDGHNFAYPTVSDNTSAWIGYPDVDKTDIFAGASKTGNDMKATIDKALADSATRDAEAILTGANA